ncbi:MAG: ParB/RepB/Spo0J family partition protein [Acidimicrobiia bacterium]
MTTRKSGLGRGLEALIPMEKATAPDAEFLHLPVDQIRANPDQPRSRFDDDALEELTASIREVGVLQPVIVGATEDGYVLIAGERRWRATKKAGMPTIPAVVRGSTGESTLVASLVENLQREDLTPLEEAHAFKQLLEDYGMSQEQVADRVGKSRPAVSNTIRLLQLPGPIQAMVDGGSLTAGHARALLGLDDSRYAIYLAERAVADGWSVRQVEDAVRARHELGKPAKPGPVRQLRPVEIIELEKRLGEHLGAPVKITYRNEKGKVEIKFGSVTELERLYRLMA